MCGFCGQIFNTLLTTCDRKYCCETNSKSDIEMHKYLRHFQRRDKHKFKQHASEGKNRSNHCNLGSQVFIRPNMEPETNY